jgi:hypothetical protein
MKLGFNSLQGHKKSRWLSGLRLDRRNSVKIVSDKLYIDEPFVLTLNKSFDGNSPWDAPIQFHWQRNNYMRINPMSEILGYEYIQDNAYILDTEREDRTGIFATFPEFGKGEVAERKFERRNLSRRDKRQNTGKLNVPMRRYANRLLFHISPFLKIVLLRFRIP